MNASSLDAGREFEDHIADRYRNAGWEVWHRARARGGADLGIDLVATRGERHVLVQCRRWSIGREVESEVVEILARDTDAYVRRRLAEHQASFDFLTPRTYGAVLIATCSLSEPARQRARELGIQFRENYVFPPSEQEHAPSSNVSFASARFRRGEQHSDWDEDVWRVNEWLTQMERRGAEEAKRRARVIEPLTLAMVSFWCSGLTIGAVKFDAWWLLIVAACPWAVFVFGVVSATGPNRDDDYVSCRIPLLVESMKRTRRARLAGELDEFDSAFRAEESLRSKIAEYFLRGRT